MVKYPVSRKFKVPQHNVKTIMGVGGAMIQRIMEEFNVKLIFDGENAASYPDGRVLQIRAFDERSAEEARKKVQDLILEANQPSHCTPSPPITNLTSNRRMHSSLDSVININPKSDSYVEDEFLVPMAYYIQVAGRSEGNLKSIKANTGISALEVGGAKMTEQGQQVRTIHLRGPAEKVAEAKMMLKTMLFSFQSKQTKEVSFAAQEDGWGAADDSWDISKSKQPNYQDNNHLSQVVARPGQVSNQVSTHSNQVINYSSKSTPILRSANRSIAFKEDSFGNNFKTNKLCSSSSTAKVNSIIKLVTELAEQMDEQEGGQIADAEIIDLKRELKMSDERIERMLVEIQKLKGDLEQAHIEKAKLEQKMDKQRMNETNNQATAYACMDCMHTNRDTVLFPCLHCPSCRKCSEQLIKCPICERSVASKLQIKL